LAWQEAMLKFGHDVSFEQVRGQIGKGGDKLIPVFLSPDEQRDHGRTGRVARQSFQNRISAARTSLRGGPGTAPARKGACGLEVLLVHPGGPFWRKKDDGVWSIPKGEIDAAEDPEQAARREFAEELGTSALIGRLQALGEVRQRGGKRVIAFAGEGHFDPAALASNTFDIEWPPRSGRRQNFPEVDRAQWFDIEFARTKMLSGQVELLDRLLAIAGESAGK
jgi:predicted NUDIX family NTP pyrophosphohydrolase